MRTESNVVGCARPHPPCVSHTLRRHLARSRNGGRDGKRKAVDVQAFFSSSESSFQSFFCSSSRCLKVCSCSAGVNDFHDASIWTCRECGKREGAGWSRQVTVVDSRRRRRAGEYATARGAQQEGSGQLSRSRERARETGPAGAVRLTLLRATGATEVEADRATVWRGTARATRATEVRNMFGGTDATGLRGARAADRAVAPVSPVSIFPGFDSLSLSCPPLAGMVPIGTTLISLPRDARSELAESFFIVRSRSSSGALSPSFGTASAVYCYASLDVTLMSETRLASSAWRRRASEDVAGFRSGAAISRSARYSPDTAGDFQYQRPDEQTQVRVPLPSSIRCFVLAPRS